MRVALDRLGARMAVQTAARAPAPAPGGGVADEAPLFLRAGLFEEAEAPPAAPAPRREQSRTPEDVRVAVVADPGVSPAPRGGWSGFVVVGAAPASAGFRSVAEAGAAR